ncbi:MAG TPA: HEAT repeat domain-containing protein [Geothrix sp.]|nr:HEAT repeat domain-containing protein [Geothrix sp.]
MKQTPFELFLDRLDPAWRADQLAFFRTVAGLGTAAVEELGGRVSRVSCPPGLRQLVLEFSYYFPWQEWIPIVDRVLRHEKDLALFDTGVRALGRMGTPKALESLRTLSLSRVTPGFSEVVNQVLQESDPAEAFLHHYSRLLQGSAQPADANEGAHQLAKLVSTDSFEPLRTAVDHPDPLIFRHALKLMGQVPSEAAAGFLLDFLKETHQEALQDREVRVLLTEFRTLPHAEVKAKVIQMLTSNWADHPSQPLTELADLASGDGERIQSAISRLRGFEPGVLDTFLLDTLTEALVDKPAHLAKALGQAGEAAQRRTRRIEFGMDSAAQSLAVMVDEGLIESDQVIPTLVESLRSGTGHAGVACALAHLVPPEAQAFIDLVLEQNDGAIRGAALEALGERSEPGLRYAFMKLRRDAITDISDRSLWHLGQLPDPVETARTFLADEDPAEVEVGLRFMAMHKLEALVPDLLERTTTESRESLLVGVLGTLGAIGSPAAVDPLVNLLHSGQAPKIQIAIAEALRDLGDPGGALALCAKAEELNSPVLRAIAVEALAKAHPTPENPLPASRSNVLIKAVKGGWSDRNPWPLRRRIADTLLNVHPENSGVWVELSSLFQSTLDEKRPPGAVSPEDLTHLQTCARALAQLAAV